MDMYLTCIPLTRKSLSCYISPDIRRNDYREDNMSVWRSLMTEFDASLPRRTAVLLKENETTTAYYYPMDFGKIGYHLDTRIATTYEEKPSFSFWLDEYVRGDFANNPILAVNSFYTRAMTTAPNWLCRDIGFPSVGLDLEEVASIPSDRGLSWSLNFKQRTLHKTADHRFHLVVKGQSELRLEWGVDPAAPDQKLLRLVAADGVSVSLAVPGEAEVGLFGGIDEYRAAIAEESLPSGSESGRYLIIAFHIHMAKVRSSKDWQEKRLVLGISSMGLPEAVDASRPDSEERTEALWNGFFSRIPLLQSGREQAERMYYKCWTVIKQNYYHHPTWGHMVLEALPVYKGAWMWGTSAIVSNSLLDPDHPAEYARNSLNLFCNNIREDGYMPHAIYIDEKVPGERWGAGEGVIQTPHLPWIALAYYEKTQDRDQLRQWYPALKQFYHYINRTRDTSLENNHLWAAKTSFDIGLDVSPQFTDITYYGEPYAYSAVFAAERIKYEQTMASICVVLGLTDEIEGWQASADATLEAANKYLWDAEAGWYGARHADGTLDTRVSVDGLAFLAYGLADGERATAMKANVRKLIAAYGVRTVAADEPGYEPDVYWRGPSWPKSCAWGAEAVARYYPDLVDEVLDSLVSFAFRWPNIWECMNGDTGAIARGDIGVNATPGVSSNVGAGELISALRAIARR
jgi:hypothetical protein